MGRRWGGRARGRPCPGRRRCRRSARCRADRRRAWPRSTGRGRRPARRWRAGGRPRGSGAGARGARCSTRRRARRHGCPACGTGGGGAGDGRPSPAHRDGLRPARRGLPVRGPAVAARGVRRRAVRGRAPGRALVAAGVWPPGRPWRPGGAGAVLRAALGTVRPSGSPARSSRSGGGDTCQPGGRFPRSRRWGAGSGRGGGAAHGTTVSTTVVGHVAPPGTAWSVTDPATSRPPRRQGEAVRRRRRPPPEASSAPKT